MQQPILIIVESPRKAKLLNSMFAGRFAAMPTYGQICALPANPPDGGLGIDRSSTQGQYELTHDPNRHIDGRRAVAQLRKFLDENPSTVVYLGMDDEQEGESLAAFVIKFLGLQTAKRMRFNTFTREAIGVAYRDAGVVNWNSVAAYEARHLIDHIIRQTVTPLLREATNKRGAAAGYPHSIVEALVVERERAIRRHKAQTAYTVHFEFGGWEVECQLPNGDQNSIGPKSNAQYDAETFPPNCLDEATAQLVAKRRALVVKSYQVNTEVVLPPSPLCTMEMLETARRILGWGHTKTMQIAQQLYEGDGSGHGHITLPRTSNPNIAPNVAEAIASWLCIQGFPVLEQPNTWTSPERQLLDGSEAIRPTIWEVKEAGATEEHRALYTLIRERTLFSQLAPALYEVKHLELTDATGAYTCTASSRVLLDGRWVNTAPASFLAMCGTPPVTTPNTLPHLQQGAMVNVKEVDVRTHSTSAPARYTPSTLTATLTELGIARSSTIAALQKQIQGQGGNLILRKDGYLEPSPLAERCYDVLYPRFGFSHIAYATELEQALDQIATGQLDGHALVRHVWDRLDADCKVATSQSSNQFDYEHK